MAEVPGTLPVSDNVQFFVRHSEFLLVLNIVLIAKSSSEQHHCIDFLLLHMTSISEEPVEPEIHKNSKDLSEIY